MQSATLITITLLIASSMALPFPSLNLLNPLIRVPDDRIVGGNVTEIEEFPYIASLQRYGMHTCGCNIISSNFLLTAAHCTYGASASMFTVRLGTSFQSSGGEMIYVKSIMQHKQFDYRSVDFDYSILELVSPIEFDKTKQPIALPKQNEEVEDFAVVVTSGWGNTQSSSESNKQLRTVEVPIVNSNVCVQAYKGMGEVTPRMICAGFEKGGKDACQGDSGGPLAYNKISDDGSEVPTLIGLTSWGYGCAKPNYPGVYSRVSYVADWIREMTNIE